MQRIFNTVFGFFMATMMGGVFFIAYAQDAPSRKSAETDWSIFSEGEPMQCWVVSAPKKTANIKSGRPVSVKRGKILLFVSFFPGEDNIAQVSFSGGYPFADGSSVTMKIGKSQFELFTYSRQETAWAASPADDAKIITAMKRGTEAVLSGRSGRGTNTIDTFSLLGFTAAVEDAEKRCKI